MHVQQPCKLHFYVEFRTHSSNRFVFLHFHHPVKIQFSNQLLLGAGWNFQDKKKESNKMLCVEG